MARLPPLPVRTTCFHTPVGSEALALSMISLAPLPPNEVLCSPTGGPAKPATVRNMNRAASPGMPLPMS
jgi:hypothetical protein